MALLHYFKVSNPNTKGAFTLAKGLCKNACNSHCTFLDSIGNAKMERKNARNNCSKCFGFINIATTNLKNACESSYICFVSLGSATANVKIPATVG